MPDEHAVAVGVRTNFTGSRVADGRGAAYDAGIRKATHDNSVARGVGFVDPERDAVAPVTEVRKSPAVGIDPADRGALLGRGDAGAVGAFKRLIGRAQEARTQRPVVDAASTRAQELAERARRHALRHRRTRFGHADNVDEFAHLARRTIEYGA